MRHRGISFQIVENMHSAACWACCGPATFCRVCTPSTSFLNPESLPAALVCGAKQRRSSTTVLCGEHFNVMREANKRHAPSAIVSDDEEGDHQETSVSVEELVAELGTLSKRLALLSEEAADLTAEAPLFRGGRARFLYEASRGQCGRL